MHGAVVFADTVGHGGEPRHERVEHRVLKAAARRAVRTVVRGVVAGAGVSGAPGRAVVHAFFRHGLKHARRLFRFRFRVIQALRHLRRGGDGDGGVFLRGFLLRLDRLIRHDIRDLRGKTLQSRDAFFGQTLGVGLRLVPLFDLFFGRVVALALRLIALDVVILMRRFIRRGRAGLRGRVLQCAVELGGHENVLSLGVLGCIFLDHLRLDGAAGIGRLRAGRGCVRLKIFIFVQNGFQGEFFCVQVKRNVLWRAIKLVHMVNSFL